VGEWVHTFQCIDPIVDGPPDASQCPVLYGLAGHFIVPIIDRLAIHFWYSLCMDWPVSIVPILASSLIITPITYGVAGCVLFPLYTNWLVS
jgi:hypothetical protein